MKNREIERRFLLYPCNIKKFLQKNGFKYESVKMEQFYIVSENLKDGVVRFRKEGKKYLKTVKRGEGLCKEEYESVISKKEFEKALFLKRGKIIKKRRYKVKVDGYIYEIDEFKGFLKDLIILETEFEKVEEAKDFKLKEVFQKIVIKEITDKKEFSNKALSLSSHIPSVNSSLEVVFKEIERRGNFLKASLNLSLSPFDSSKNLSKAVLFSLLKTIKANKKAILSGDKDIERLHQLRVALRKARSVFSLLRFVFSPDFAKKMNSSLSSLMKKTNEKRDIDVYLSVMDTYEKILPLDLKEGIRPFRECLLSIAEDEEKDLVKFLKSEEFESTIKDLMKFCLEKDKKYLSNLSDLPSVIIAKRVIFKTYSKIIKESKKLSSHSHAREFHKIRIEFKKLRYLSEFFSFSFEKSAYEKWRGTLKEIQTDLGEHQDIFVQRKHLKHFLKLKEAHNEKTLKAIKYLRKHMKEAQKEKRALFLKKLKEFQKSKDLIAEMICHG